MNILSKYLTLLKLSWQEGFVYRLNVVLWRFRQLLATLMSLTVWSVIFTDRSSAFAYSRPQMITYIFVIAFLQSVVFATALHGLSSMIYRGDITNHLLKPVNMYVYFFVIDVADKLKNFFFIIAEAALLFLIFKPEIVLPALDTNLLFILWLGLAVLLHFFITLLFGSIGFWSPDSWGPRFLFFMIVDFTAGKLFPLDILPESIQSIIDWTPFPYLSYYQTQLFLGRVPSTEFLPLTAKLIAWCVILGVLAIGLWQKGIKNYEAVGR